MKIMISTVCISPCLCKILTNSEKNHLYISTLVNCELQVNSQFYQMFNNENAYSGLNILWSQDIAKMFVFGKFIPQCGLRETWIQIVWKYKKTNPKDQTIWNRTFGFLRTLLKYKNEENCNLLHFKKYTRFANTNRKIRLFTIPHGISMPWNFKTFLYSAFTFESRFYAYCISQIWALTRILKVQ